MTTRRTVAGFSLTEFVQPPHCRLPRHEHAHASICFVVAGSYAERARGREAECRTRSMVFKPAAEPHADVFGGSGGRCLLIEILPGRVDHAAPFDRVTQRPWVARTARLAALGARLHGELFADDAAAPLALEGLILETLADASRVATDESATAEPVWLRRARELLHERHADAPTLSALAAAVGVDGSHLARTFRKRHGCTVGEYVRRLRVERAARDMASGAPLAEIALRAGFFDQSHFAKVFRRQTGMTPTEYRKRVSGKSA